MAIQIQDPTAGENRLLMSATGRIDFEAFRSIEKAARKSRVDPPGQFVLDLTLVDGLDPWLVGAIEKHLSDLERQSIEVALVCDTRKAARVSGLRNLKETFLTVNKVEDLPAPKARPEPERPAPPPVAAEAPPPVQEEAPTWLIRKHSGKVYGYFRWGQLGSFIKEGRLVASDDLSQSKEGPWLSAAEQESLKPHFERKSREKISWRVQRMDGEIRGPHSEDEIVALLRSREIGPADSLASSEEPEAWKSPGALPFFAAVLGEIGETPTQQESPAEAEGARRQPLLTISEGPEVGREFPVLDGLTTIGRGSDVDWGFLDKLMSRTHCKLVRRGDAVVLTDLGSTNGTFVNDAKIDQRDLQEGDLVRIGGIVFVYSLR